MGGNGGQDATAGNHGSCGVKGANNQSDRFTYCSDRYPHRILPLLTPILDERLLCRSKRLSEMLIPVLSSLFFSHVSKNEKNPSLQVNFWPCHLSYLVVWLLWRTERQTLYITLPIPFERIMIMICVNLDRNYPFNRGFWIVKKCLAIHVNTAKFSAHSRCSGVLKEITQNVRYGNTAIIPPTGVFFFVQFHNFRKICFQYETAKWTLVHMLAILLGVVKKVDDFYLIWLRMKGWNWITQSKRNLLFEVIRKMIFEFVFNEAIINVLLRKFPALCL